MGRKKKRKKELEIKVLKHKKRQLVQKKLTFKKKKKKYCHWSGSARLKNRQYEWMKWTTCGLMGLVRAHTHTPTLIQKGPYSFSTHTHSRPQVYCMTNIHTPALSCLLLCPSQPRENNSRQENKSYINNILNLQGGRVPPVRPKPPNNPSTGTI